MVSTPPSIILATANARYAHASFGLRYLMANLGKYQDDAEILEFTINDRPLDVAEKILEKNPSIIVFSVFIWNVSMLDETVQLIKLVRPAATVILGGPEVSFKDNPPPVCTHADHIIGGEGELILPSIIEDIRTAPGTLPKFIQAPLPDLNQVELPYHLYTEQDLAHRVVYVETSRGCPYGCEFCISSLDAKVRRFPPDKIQYAIESLWQRGVRQFKFVDRTLNLSSAGPVLQFFANRKNQGVFLHFEIIPDKISEKMFALLAQFPAGAVQLEAGIQTFNEEVAHRIGRKQNMDLAETNIKRLLTETGVHIHSDLVAGLPGEDLHSFAQSFNRLINTGVHEIQVGILKRLRGAPIDRHTEQFKMVYRHVPPYDILKNNRLDFEDVQGLKRFSRYFDLVFNNGNFETCAPLIWNKSEPFSGFWKFSNWLFNKTGQTSNIALNRLAELLFEYLTDVNGLSDELVANSMLGDFDKTGRRRFPKPVRDFATLPIPDYNPGTKKNAPLPERQQRKSSN